MKTTFSGRGLFLLVAVFAIAITFNSCRKDLLVQSPDNLKNALSIAEAKSYFEKNFSAPSRPKTLMSVGGSPQSAAVTAQSIFDSRKAIWSKAYQQMVSIGGAVKVPLDFGPVRAIVNIRARHRFLWEALTIL